MQNCYFPVASAAADEASKALLEQGKRLDGARASSDELRRAFMRLGVVSGAAGSAYVEMGRTRVVCAVYGPRNDTRARREFSKEGQLVCDFKYAPFADPEGRRERGQVRNSVALGPSSRCMLLRLCLTVSTLRDAGPGRARDVVGACSGTVARRDAREAA